MAHLRAVGLLVLLSAVPAVAESVTIELTPRGMVWLWLHAPDRAMAESLGTELGRSLGCTLSGVTESPDGGEWVFHARCPGVFQRQGQVLEGQLKLGVFRQALTKASIQKIHVHVVVSGAPYSRSAFPPAWHKISRNERSGHRGTQISTQQSTLELCELYDRLQDATGAVEMGLGHGITAGVHGDGVGRRCRSAAAAVAVFSISKSIVAHFPIVSEATVYFALVWTANVLWDLVGHRFAATVETVTA